MSHEEIASMPLTFQEIYTRLLEKFSDAVVTGIQSNAKDPWIEVSPASIATVAEFLKTDPQLRFESLCDLTGVDYLEPDPKLTAKFPYSPHVEVVYHLLSLTHRHSLTVKVVLPRWQDDRTGQLPEVPSVSGVWAIANWHEREAFDLVGIRFLNHPNLTRILCVDDWVGHALRKDYEFPLEYHGMRGK